MKTNIKEYIKEISPEKFEELCVEYLRYIKGNTFKIKGTRYCKDGGKDIVGSISEEIPYEIWAECKKHTRAIGLDEIAKNVVLVLSENINELIFFSTSNITSGAQKHISNLAARHNFSVAYYYGDKLISALSELPIFRNNIETNITLQNVGLNTKLFLSKYADSNFYEKGNTIVLQRDTVFYIDIFLNNHSSNKITNIVLNISKTNDMLLYLQPYNTNFDLQPHCDQIIQIKVNVVNCLNKCKIPAINISYEQDGKKKYMHLFPGYVDPTSLTYFPLIGVEINKFLKLSVEPILSKKESISYIIDIRGGAGVGKSRLIKEILLIADTYNWHIKHYDGKNVKDVNILKDFICSLIGLPFYSGNINFTSNEIRKILISQGDNEDFAEVIYDFIYMNRINDEILYYIEDAIIYWIKNPYLKYPYILAIDNIQELDSSVLKILKHLFETIKNLPTQFLIILGSNTERLPNRNIENIEQLFKLLDDYDDNFRLHKDINPMDKCDAKTFYVNVLKNIDKHECFLNFLIAKAGTRPLDIIMQIKYMQEKKVIVFENGSSWFIHDFNEDFIEHIPLKSNQLIQQRVNAHLSFFSKESEVNDYNKNFKLMIKLLLIFKDNLPIPFIYDIDIKEEVISKLMESLFFKYDDDEPEIHFFHNNLYLYFSKQRIYLHDNVLLKKVVKWLDKNNDYQIKKRDAILLQCYISLKNYGTAQKIGIEYLKNNYDNFNYSEAIDIANLLLNNKHFQLDYADRFRIKLLLADSYRGKIDHEKGSIYYNELLQDVESKKINLSENEINQFYKDAINANLNSNHPDIALDILNSFEKTQIKNPYYKFILYDRYAVVNLALGKIEESKDNIEKAIIMAEKTDNDNWKGIAYSDYAYLHYRGYQNKEETLTYFLKAYDAQFSDLKYQNRIGELLQQKSFAELLCGNYDEALEKVNESLDVCHKIHSTYLEVKAINLKGIILVYSNEKEKALKAWADGIDLCQETKNLPCSIRIYSNLGAFFLAKNQLSDAEDYLCMAYKLFKKNGFSQVHYKELFYNIIRLNITKGNNEHLENILYQYPDPDIEYFYELCLQNSCKDYGILYYNNSNFIF